MSRHVPIRPCDAPRELGTAFRARPCGRPPQDRGCCRVLHLAGELDIAATPALLLATGRALGPSPGRGAGPGEGERERPPVGLVLDLGALTFCDAAGLTGLLRAARLAGAAGVPVSLSAPPRTVVRILGLCGLHRSFSLHPSTGH